MKKSILVSIFALFSFLSFSQTVVKERFLATLSCSQKYGLTVTEGDFILTVTFDDDTIKFSTSEGQDMTSYNITKKTDKYVVGKDISGNYSFFNIKKKQFFFIDYFMSRYMT